MDFISGLFVGVLIGLLIGYILYLLSKIDDKEE